MESGSQANRKTSAPAAPPRARRPSARLGLGLALVGLLFALVRLPLIRTAVDVSPDGCEYLGIARHVAFERHWTSSLKWNFFTPAPVVHPALADRPPLYPLWAAAWVALSSQPSRQVWLARLGNLLLAGLTPAMIYWALLPAVSEVAAALAAVIFMLYPAFARNSAQPLTEPLFLLLTFGSLGLFLRATSPFDWFITGLLAGLSFLTRPTGILLPILYTVVLAVTRGSSVGRGQDKPGAHSSPQTVAPSHHWRPFFLAFAGFVLPLIPYWIAVAVQTGSPFTSILRYNYSVRNINEGTFYGFERHFDPPFVFVQRHAREVLRLVLRQWRAMGWPLVRSLQYLLPLALFERRRMGSKWWTLLGFAMLNFLFHAFSWTVWGAARYLFPTYIIGLALLLDAPVRWAGVMGEDGSMRKRGNMRAAHSTGGLRAPSLPDLAIGLLSTGAVIMGVSLTLTACMRQDLKLYREKSRPDAGVPLGWAYAAAGQRLAETPRQSLCAANQPWILNLLAQRPAVMAPRFQDAAQLRRYLAHYRPATLTLFVTEREPGDVATARRLTRNLWTQPSLRPELTDTLELATAVLRTRHVPRQALLIFRVRPAAIS